MNLSTEDVYKQQKKNNREKKNKVKLIKLKRKWSLLIKTKKILKKLFLASSLILLSSLTFINSSNAVTLDAAHVYSIGRCPYLVKYQGSARIVDYVQYDYNGVSYPAYCLDKTKKRSRHKWIYSFNWRYN